MGVLVGLRNAEILKSGLTTNFIVGLGVTEGATLGPTETIGSPKVGEAVIGVMVAVGLRSMLGSMVVWASGVAVGLGVSLFVLSLPAW